MNDNSDRHVADPNDDQQAEAAQSVDPGLARNGALSYIHIPALDVHQSAAFYEQVFSWRIRARDTAHPGFDDGAGHLSGAWVTDLAIARFGPAALHLRRPHRQDPRAGRRRGGEIVRPPYPEGTPWVATFRDPAGNVLGVYHDGAR